MFSKKVTFTLILSYFFLISCSSIDIQRHESDLVKEKHASKNARGACISHYLCLFPLRGIGSTAG